MNLLDGDLDVLLAHLTLGAQAQLAGWGTRDVSGQYNSLQPGQSLLGAADQPFRVITGQVASLPAEPVPTGLTFGPPAGTPTAYDNTSTFIVDSRPREISNLIGDEPTPHRSSPHASDGLATSKLHTVFGQYFTHDLDLVPKGADGLIYLPLLPGDPLYISGSSTNFMIMSRANYDVAPTTGERIYDNLISSWVDMSVNYGTHAVMTALLKEYDANGVATGRMLQHFEAPGSQLNGGLPNWADIKINALRIGITLVDQDVLNLPQLKFNADGSLYRNASGMAEVVIEGGQVVRTGHAFLDDMGNGASPSPGLLPDDNTTIGGALQSGRYDNELLNEHFISGDGRNNENYPLTAVHGIFQAEHNRVFGQLQALITTRGPAYAAQWTGDMLFEATKIVVEAEYQQIVFDEYLARLTPNIDTYAGFTDLTQDCDHLQRVRARRLPLRPYPGLRDHQLHHQGRRHRRAQPAGLLPGTDDLQHRSRRTATCSVWATWPMPRPASPAWRAHEPTRSMSSSPTRSATSCLGCRWIWPR